MSEKHFFLLSPWMKTVTNVCPFSISGEKKSLVLGKFSLKSANPFFFFSPIQDCPPYDKGAFRIEIIFPAEYPFKPPKITFKTKIYHPNIDEKGQVCLPIISVENWKPATKTCQGEKRRRDFYTEALKGHRGNVFFLLSFFAIMYQSVLDYWNSLCCNVSFFQCLFSEMCEVLYLCFVFCFFTNVPQTCVQKQNRWNLLSVTLHSLRDRNRNFLFTG